MMDRTDEEDLMPDQPDTEHRLDPIAVVGAGQMGAGIAEVLARAGNQVRLVDARPGVADQVTERLALSTLRPAETLEDAVLGAGLIVEAVSEDLQVKADLLGELGRLTPAAIIASNSSTFGPSELAPHAADPGRLVVAHFFYPATVVPLVELVPSEHSDPGVLDAVQDLLAGAGRTVVRLRRDVPGFVANRLQAALLREAIHLVEEGVLDVAGIDEIVTASIGVRWSLAGPFRISDLGGLDVWAAVCGRLWPDLGADTVPTWLQQRVAAGELGAKSGRGAYDPAEPAGEAYLRGLAERYAESAGSAGS
ncbi:3-hydroxyacyl-CoA dehydrogenase [Enemella evansiae]|nr:3-hydroxyacyl-CoA dehydrogenase [Enemella evansiae]